jgi:hypothetical protein
MAKNIGNIDESVKVPAAIRAAAAQAEAAYHAAYNPQNEEQDGDQTQEQEATSAETTETAPVETFETPANEVSKNANSAPEPAKSEDDQSWEHRYNSMKGRFDRSQKQIKDLSEQIASLQSIVATLEMQRPVASSAGAETKTERFITPEEESDYGAEFLSVVGKKAKEEMLPIVKQYETKIAELEAKLQGVNGYVSQSARTRMLSDLDDKVPEWREINRNEEFLAWLELPDLYSGAIRHELLKAAYERNDAPRVLAFFNGFLAEEAATRPATSAVAQETGARAPVLDASKLAAPGRAKSAAGTSAPAEKPIFTGAQIAKFYAEVAAGKYRGKEAEKDRLEGQIFEATRDGRVR